MFTELRVVMYSTVMLIFLASEGVNAGRDGISRRDVASDQVEQMAVPAQNAGAAPAPPPQDYQDDYIEEEETESEDPDSADRRPRR